MSYRHTLGLLGDGNGYKNFILGLRDVSEWIWILALY
jgi:hypothetical protein